MKRRGIILMEAIVAGALLMALTMLCVKYFAVTALQRRALNQRQTALLEAANIMEGLSARPFDNLTSDTLSKISLSPETKFALPEGELKIDLADEIVMQSSRPPENAGETPAAQTENAEETPAAQSESAGETPAPQKAPQVAESIRKPAAKRIKVEIRWRDKDGQWVQGVRLVAWRFQ